jgi:hypothetical protein
MGILWLMKSEKRLLKILMDSIQLEIGKSLLKNSASLQSHRPSCLQPIRSAIARIIERKAHGYLGAAPAAILWSSRRFSELSRAIETTDDSPPAPA